MISDGSCDTEDWSNDAENSALHHRNKLHLKYIKVQNKFFKLELYFTILECTFPEENVKWCLQWQNSPPGC